MSHPWKILVYLAADNNLYEEALVSLGEMIHVSRLGGIEILVQFDGPTASLASRFRCVDGTKILEWQAEPGYTANRGTRLTDFLHWALPNAGRDCRVFLGLWGHGAGIDHTYVYSDGRAPTQPAPVYRPGFQLQGKDLLDSGNANIYVSNVQLGDILKKFAAKRRRPLDILGLDACLMGMAEIAHEVRESVALMVASDEEIPLSSWPYRAILGDLSKYPSMDPSTLSSVIISRYVERYLPEETDENNRFAASLSCYNLSACQDFAVAFRKLVKAIRASLVEATTMARVMRARDFSRTPYEATYIDVAAFLNELTESFNGRSGGSKAIREAASDALHVLLFSSLLVYHRHLGEDGAVKYRGLALYFPETRAPEEVNIAQLDNDVDADQASKHKPRYPVQPASIGSGKMPTADRKMPTADRKMPTATRRIQTATRKVISAPDGTVRTITSYRIIWSHYARLQFNEETGWADLVKKFLPHHALDM